MLITRDSSISNLRNKVRVYLDSGTFLSYLGPDAVKAMVDAKKTADELERGMNSSVNFDNLQEALSIAIQFGCHSMKRDFMKAAVKMEELSFSNPIVPVSTARERGNFASVSGQSPDCPKPRSHTLNASALQRQNETVDKTARELDGLQLTARATPSQK